RGRRAEIRLPLELDVDLGLLVLILLPLMLVILELLDLVFYVLVVLEILVVLVILEILVLLLIDNFLDEHLVECRLVFLGDGLVDQGTFVFGFVCGGAARGLAGALGCPCHFTHSCKTDEVTGYATHLEAFGTMNSYHQSADDATRRGRNFFSNNG